LEAGLFLPGESVLHQADPRLKIAALVLLGFLITTAQPSGLLILSVGLMILTAASRIPIREFKGVVWAGLVLGGFYLVVLGWNWSEGWRIWEGHWSQAGLLQAGLIMWRIGVVFIFTRIFTAVTSPAEQGIGIAYFFTPFYRLTPKAADLALLITLTLRFIPLLIEEASLLYKARVAKGNLPVHLFGKLLELATFLLPLLLLTLRRAEELADNLVARGYSSGNYRVLGSKEWERRDTWGAFFLILWGVAAVVADRLVS
jgi:energy-coupling factor transport system permease protein